MTQLTIDDASGKALKEAGLDTAEVGDATFISLMRAEAIRLSALYGRVTSDDLRLFACSNKIHPRHHNSYGAVFRGKCWKIIGRIKSVIPSNHYRELKVWKYYENPETA